MQFGPREYLEDDPTRLIPELLDRLAELGDLAKQVSGALNGNGHRAEKITEIKQYFEHQAER